MMQAAACQHLLALAGACDEGTRLAVWRALGSWSHRGAQGEHPSGLGDSPAPSGLPGSAAGMSTSGRPPTQQQGQQQQQQQPLPGFTTSMGGSSSQHHAQQQQQLWHPPPPLEDPHMPVVGAQAAQPPRGQGGSWSGVTRSQAALLQQIRSADTLSELRRLLLRYRSTMQPRHVSTMLHALAGLQATAGGGGAQRLGRRARAPQLPPHLAR